MISKYFLENVILNEVDAEEDELDHINPTGEDNNDENNNNNNNEPNTNENNNQNNNQDNDDQNTNEEDDDTELDDTENDEDNSNDSVGYESNPNSISSKLKDIEKKVDEHLDGIDVNLRKTEFYKSFEYLYESIIYIYDSLKSYFNILNSKNKYDDVLNNLNDVKNSVYIYMTKLYNDKSYIESKCFFTDVLSYLFDLNKMIQTIKIEEIQNNG